MKATEIMTRDVVVVRPETTVHDAALLLTEHGITSAPVLDDDDRVIGIVSEVDLIRGRMPHDPRAHLRPEATSAADPPRTVREVMSDSVICMSQNADVADLAALMVDNKVRAIPIIDGSHLLGIVSRRDLLRTLVRDDEVIRAEVLARLAEFSGMPHTWDVDVRDGIVTVGGHFDDDEMRIVEVLARAVAGVLQVHCHKRWFAHS